MTKHTADRDVIETVAAPDTTPVPPVTRARLAHTNG